jgi:alpha-N-arabinofuranosidase
VPVRVAFARLGAQVAVHELWHDDVQAKNSWARPDEVAVASRTEEWTGAFTFRAHSFVMLVFDLE